jgi:phosphoribosyl 1,2-cyclic phosphate phosphodiesterase
LGYRIGKFAYMTDFKQIEPQETEKLKGVDTLVINALRFEPHHSHFNVEEAMDVVEKVQPRQTFLTHLSHDIGLHALSEGTLPQGVRLGYDMLTFDIK